MKSSNRKRSAARHLTRQFWLGLGWVANAVGVAEGAPMIEYAIFVVMVIFTIGFAWLWLIEQQKKEARRKNEIERR